MRQEMTTEEIYKIAPYVEEHYKRCWVEGYIAGLQALNSQKDTKPEWGVLPGCEELTPEEKMNHPLYLEGFDMGREVQKVFDEQNKATLDDIAEKYAEKLDISKGWFDGCEIDELIKESYKAGADE